MPCQAIADGFVRLSFAVVRRAETCYTPVIENGTDVRNRPEVSISYQAVTVTFGNQLVHR